jgi:DNA-binding CsgD family transcriptional regulator
MIADVELNGVEKEILYMMQKGLSSNEIASLFNCSKEMINKHRHSILQKTKCSTMFDVFALGAKKGWI